MSTESPEKMQNSQAVAALVKILCEKYVSGRRILNNNDVETVCQSAGLHRRTSERAKTAWETLVSGNFVLSMAESNTEVQARMAKEVTDHWSHDAEGKASPIPKSSGYGDNGIVFYIQLTILYHESLVEPGSRVAHYKYLLDILAKDDVIGSTVLLRESEVAVGTIFWQLVNSSTERRTSENTEDNLIKLSSNKFDALDLTGFEELITRMEFMLVPKDEKDKEERIYAVAEKFLQAPLFGKQKRKATASGALSPRGRKNLLSVERKDN